MTKTALRPRADYRHWHRIDTRWHDNDIYGHVNNTVYYAWFDTAVNAWLVQNRLLELEGQGPIGLVVETGCLYAAPVSFPGGVDIGLAVAKIGRSSVIYQIGVFLPDEDAPVAEGHFTHVYVDRQQRRPVEISSATRLALETLVGAEPGERA